MYQSYKRMEQQLGLRQRKLQAQAVEIKSSLGMLEHLDGMEGDQTLNTDFRSELPPCFHPFVHTMFLILCNLG